MTIREELEQVFDDEFDINACEALYRFVSTLTGGKTKLVRAVLDNFGYSVPLRLKLEKVSISTRSAIRVVRNYVGRLSFRMPAQSKTSTSVLLYTYISM